MVWVWLVAVLLNVPAPVGSQAAEATSTTCDRAASREANSVITAVLQPRIEKLGYSLPDACPLDADKNMFKVQEAHKILMRKNVWKCTWDQKVRPSVKGSTWKDQCEIVFRMYALCACET